MAKKKIFYCPDCNEEITFIKTQIGRKANRPFFYAHYPTGIYCSTDCYLNTQDVEEEISFFSDKEMQMIEE